MKTPRFTDNRPKYHDSQKSQEPGYLARRLKAYARLQRMRSRTSNVQALPTRRVASK
jgi:hypothetical protein